MPAPLRLELTDYLDATRWRWVLSDSSGHFLADHSVRLDPTSREYAGFLDLGQYLDYNQPIYPPERQLRDLGAWIGEQVFGGLRDALWRRRALPALAVHVRGAPGGAGAAPAPLRAGLLRRRQELPRAPGVRFVYALEGARGPGRGQGAGGEGPAHPGRLQPAGGRQPAQPAPRALRPAAPGARAEPDPGPGRRAARPAVRRHARHPAGGAGGGRGLGHHPPLGPRRAGRAAAGG